MNKVKNILFLLLLLCISISTHDDDDHRPSRMQKCIDRCIVEAPTPSGNDTDFNGSNLVPPDDSTTNNTDTVFQVDEAEIQKCEEQCEKKFDENNVLGIVIVSVLFGIILITCLICFLCHGPCRKKWANYSEAKKRKPVANNLTPEEFAAFADQFKTIFTEGEREMWIFTYTVNGLPQPIQWFSLDLHRIQDYQYDLNIKGQDFNGVWEGKGFFLNTNQGPTAWWFKNYENSAERQRDAEVYELIRCTDGSYHGVWYLRGLQRLQQLVSLSRKLGGNGDGEVNEEEINYDIISGSSEEVF